MESSSGMGLTGSEDNIGSAERLTELSSIISSKFKVVAIETGMSGWTSCV
jgi:hypothetical protein